MNYYAKFLVFPVYMVLMLLFVLYVTLNTKKLRFKYSFDSLPIIMALYLFHVFVCLGVMKGGIIMLGLTSLVMAPIVISTYRMQIIGVTGSIGSGKSTVSKMLNEEFKLPLIDCDILARRVVEVGKPAYNKIVKEFGTGILEEKTKEINRKALGEIVFADNAKRKKLTKITGLYIALEILKDLFIYSRSSGEPIILDAPILFESKYLQHICFPIIVVDAGDEALQVKRVMARDNLKKEEVQNRINSQMPISIKLKKADIKLINNTEVADLRHSLINQLYPYLI